MSHYPLIRSLSIININGIMARTLSLVNPHELRPSRQYGGTISLLGNNGAGKTSLLGAFMFSQIPDIRYISLGTKDDFKVSSSIKDSEMFPRLGQPSIVALEIEARGTGQRHLYVVRAEKITGTTLNTRLFCLTLPQGVKPLDCLLDRNGMRAWPVTVEQLRDKAALLGCAIQGFKDSNAYMLALFQDGILPRACQSADDKYRLAQILHSAMAGRLDKSIEKHLSTYLMAHTRGNVNSVVNMVNESMIKVRQTQKDLDSYQKDYQFFNSLLTLSLQFSANTWAVTETNLDLVDDGRISAQKEKYRIERELEKIEGGLRALQRDEENIKSEQLIILQQREDVEPRRLCAVQGQIHYQNEQNAISELNKLEPLLGNAEKQYQCQNKMVTELVRKKEENIDSQRRVTQQLAHVGTRYAYAQKMASQYSHAKQLYDDVNQWCPDVTLSTLDVFIDQLGHQEQKAGKALSYSLRQLQFHQDILAAYTHAADYASQLGDSISPPEGQLWFMEKRALLDTWRIEAGLLTALRQHKQVLQDDQQKQLRLQQRLRDVRMLSLLTSDETYTQQLAIQQEQELRLNEQKEQLAQRQTEVEAEVKRLEIDIVRYEQQSQQWHHYQPSVNYLRNMLSDDDFTLERCEQLALDYGLKIKTLRQNIINSETEIKQLRQRRDQLNGREAGSLEYLRILADEVSGISVAELYADTEVQDAGYIEAALGPLMFGILVNGDVDDAVRLLLSRYGEQWPLPDVVLIRVTPSVEVLRNESFESNLLFKDITDEYNAIESIFPPWCVIDEPHYRRISQTRSEPVLGNKAREALIEQLSQQILQAEEGCEVLEREVEESECCRENLKNVSGLPSFIWGDEPPLEETLRQRNLRRHALDEIAEKYQHTSRQWQTSQRILQVLQECEPDSKILFRDISQALREIERQIQQAEAAERKIRRYQPVLNQLEQAYPLLRETYPEDLEQVHQQVELDENNYNTCSMRVRQVKQLNSVRAHLAPEYASAQELLENEEQAQTILLENQKRLGHEGVFIKSKLDGATQLLEEKKRCHSDLVSSIESQKQIRNRARNSLDNLPYAYFPRQEIQLALQLTAQDSLLSQNRARLAECAKKTADAHLLRSHEESQLKAQNICLNNLTEESESIAQQRDQIVRSLKANGSYAELEPAMREGLVRCKAQPQAALSLIDQSLLASLNQLVIGYSISQAEPFMQQLMSCARNTPDIIECYVTLYGQAVAFFHRRSRQDIQRTSQPRQMLQALSQAAKDAQMMLAETEATFQMRREDLADALSRRINDEKRAINRLTADLKGIGFGQVAGVCLEARSVKHFQDTLAALKSGGYGMDDLFSTAGTVTEVLAGLYKKINQHEIDGAHLLDHRNYLDVKTLIRRRGEEKFELLNASSLSTGERIGSGLAVLIAVLKHWGRNSHGNKEPFTLPLVMDEVSRLDAASQATVHELAVRTGCQMLVAAPETLGQITGIGYQLVRTIITESTGVDGRSVTRHQVKITGIRDAQQLPFDAEDSLGLQIPTASGEGGVS